MPMLVDLILHESICLLMHWMYCSEAIEDGTYVMS